MNQETYDMVKKISDFVKQASTGDKPFDAQSEDAIESAFMILGEFLSDISRIADSLEKIADHSAAAVKQLNEIDTSLNSR